MILMANTAEQMHEIEHFNQNTDSPKNIQEQMGVLGYTPETTDKNSSRILPPNISYPAPFLSKDSSNIKGLTYGELIVDNILFLDNNYESSIEGIYNKFSEDKKGFLKALGQSIYDSAKKFMYEPSKIPGTDTYIPAELSRGQKVGEFVFDSLKDIKDAVVRLSSEDLDARLQNMFNVNSKDATNEQVSQARESVIVDTLAALELIPALGPTAKVTKETISGAVKLADRVTVNPSALGTIGGNFALRTPGETGNFKRAIDFFKKKGGTDPNNFKDINRKMYNKFGWYINPSDGQWRYQISDKNSKLDLKNFKVQIRNLGLNETKTLKLSDILTHDQLFKRYPHLKNINVQFENRFKNPITDGLPSLGSFSGGDNLIKINVNKDRGVDVSNLGNSASFKATLFHEIQHAIQEYEGFIPGTSTINIPIEVTKKHSTMLANNLDFNRNQRKKIIEEIEGSALEHKINTDTLLAHFLQDRYLKTGVVLFTSEDEVIKKFADAVEKVGLPPNIFDVPPGSSKAFLDLSDDLNRLRNSFLDDVKTKKAIGYIEDLLYRGSRGELESTGVEVELDSAQNKLRYPLDVEQDIIKARKLEDFAGSLDETAQQALIPEDPGYYRRQTYRKANPGVVDVKVDIDLTKYKYHKLDQIPPAKDLNDPEYLAYQKLSKESSAVKRRDARTKFLLDNIIKDNSQLKKVKNLKNGDTFSYTLPNGKTVKVKFDKVKTQKIKRSDLSETDDTLIIKDTRPNKYKEEMSDFIIPYARLEIIDSDAPDLEITIPNLIKNSDLVKDGKNFNLLDLGDTRPEEGAFSKIKSLFGFAEGGDTVKPEPKPETRPFPDVKPQAKPDSDEYRGRTYDIYSVEIDGIETNVIEFKDGKKISAPQIRQMFEEYKSASESIPGKQTSQEISKFLEDNNPTYDEFIRHFTAKRINKGGLIGDQMEMAFMNEGGLTDDGMDVDPVSGNDIPSGSMAEEVRDDIPAQLSDGEYVVPADVVRYYGVKFFEDLRDQAKMGLAQMEADGRIGGEPVPAGGPINTEELSPEEMQAIQEMMGMSEGGSVNALKTQQELLEQPANKAVGNPQMMYGGGQVRGYQNSSLVAQAESNLLGGQSLSQVEQQMLSAAGNKPYTGQPLGFSLFGGSNTGVKQDQSQTSAFTPIFLYNKAGQNKYVSSEKEKAKAIADGYTMTLEQYNIYRSQSGGSGGSGGSSSTVTTGDEDKEIKSWGQAVNWNNVDDIKQFVAQAERGNLSGSGRFLRGAGFAIAGLPGAMLAGAFQIGKGLNSIYDMEAAKIIAEAKGHTELATEIQEGIDTYLKTAGDIANFLYKPESKAVMRRVDGVFAGTGYEDVNSWAAGTRRTIVSDYKKGKEFDSKKSKQAGDKRKRKAMKAFNKLQKNKDSYIASSSTPGETADNISQLEKSLSASAQNPSGTISLNKGGLMQKKKKAKK